MSLVLNQALDNATTAATRRRYHWAWLLFALVVLAVATALQVPQESVTIAGAPLPEICLSRRLFGLDCPGCGLTRSVVSLAHGQVARAWRFNPAGLLWFAALLWQLPYRAVQLYLLRAGRQLVFRRGLGEGVLLFLMLACIVQWAARHVARWL
jgi:hypothetical protein